MTSISSGNAALLILQQSQSSLLAGPQGQSASDAILDIVSNRSAAGMKAAAVSASTAAKAATEAAQGPREAGGTVSSEFSSIQWSAMNAAAVNQLQSSDADDDLIAFKPTKASFENAQAFAEGLADAVKAYNAQFDVKAIPSREEFMARKESWLARQTALGATDQQIQIGLELNFGDGGYERNVKWMEQINWGIRKGAELASTLLQSARDRLSETFGVDVKIAFGDDGRVSVSDFDIGRDGQKVLSFSQNGERLVTSAGSV